MTRQTGATPNTPQRIDPATRPRPTRLNGPRLTLRTLTEDDLAPLAEVLSAPGVREWWPIHSVDELRADVMGDEETVALAVELRGALIGVIMYTEQLWRDYFSAGVDLALGAQARGQGFGPEALRLVISWLFNEGGHHRITIDPAASNRRAIRAYEKVGFRPVGVMREYERSADGTWRDGLLMDLLRREFVR